MSPNHIAVLGGGITGLSSAFHLARRFPTTQITLVEKQKRLGGWVHSERVKLDHDIYSGPASLVLEAGPRTLRPNSDAVLELIHLLGLESSLITTSKTSPAARARFLHIPGSPGLVQIPSSSLQLLSSPLFSLLASAVAKEPFTSKNREPNAEDESFHSFMSRRFGEPFARTFGSALVHGVYAADSRELSIRAAFPTIWSAEERGWGSVVLGFLRGNSKTQKTADYETGRTKEHLQDTAVYAFRGGMESLTQALSDQLKKRPNIRILHAKIDSLQLEHDKTTTIHTDLGTLQASHVASTIPLPKLSQILPGQHSLPYLTTNPYSTVSVINLVFNRPPTDIHPPGFGYLIPRPADGYEVTKSGVGMLGTVFDSCSLSEQDTIPATEAMTKVTVMAGGPYYSSGACSPSDLTVDAVLHQLEAHLQRKLPEPVYTKVWQNKECIPTLKPGHLRRMAELRKELDQKEGWAGRLEVVGAGVGGVSIGDCVEAGKRVGTSWRL